MHHNQERKRVQEITFDECISLKETQCGDDIFPIIRAENAHEGITGIVAGKLKDMYNQPVIIATPCEGVLKGTGRSTDKVDMFHILDSFRHLFIRFGGHHGACGFLIAEENFPEFRERANEALREKLMEEPGLLDAESHYDLVLTGRDMTLDLVTQLEKMEPFGCRNRRPVFLLESVEVNGLQKMGRDGIHVRFFARCRDGSRAECVLFCKAEQYAELLTGDSPVNVLGTLQINQWNGTRKVQMLVDRICPASGTLS